MLHASVRPLRSNKTLSGNRWHPPDACSQLPSVGPGLDIPYPAIIERSTDASAGANVLQLGPAG